MYIYTIYFAINSPSLWNAPKKKKKNEVWNAIFYFSCSPGHAYERFTRVVGDLTA